MAGAHYPPMRRVDRGILLVVLLLLPRPMFAQSEAAPSERMPPEPAAAEQQAGGSGVKDILNMDIEQLANTQVVVPSMDMPVTSVTRQPSTVGHSAAAIFVITPEMIRRSGATSVPEALRMVPGLDVARINSTDWAITSRGFNDRFANKLLVLIDGRAVYTPLFSGVYWEVQNLILEDIERIEVIRGPGATVWGANAVNGVINIITKSARDTQGGLAVAGGGTSERALGSFRYGGQAGEGVYYRAYGKYFDCGPGVAPYGANDSWQLGQGGFRLDWEVDRLKTDLVTFQGDYYNGSAGLATEQPVFPDPSGNFEALVKKTVPLQGGNLLTRWTHTVDKDSDYSLQFYYDRLERDDPAMIIRQDTFDLDFHDRFPLSDRQHIVWGGGYRSVTENVNNSSWLALLPPHQQVNLVSAFVQDEITLVEDHLMFTPGCKLEYNDLSGVECQPSLRLLWMFDKQSSAWGAISRAVRTPSIAEETARIVGLPFFQGLPVFPLLLGNPELQSEAVMAYELGYRRQATEQLSWDVALFFNHYNDLRTLTPVLDPSVGPFFIPFSANNDMAGDTYGVELFGQWEITKRWRLRGYYAFLMIRLQPGPTAVPGSDLAQGESPQNQVYLSSSWDLGRNVDFDLIARYVESLPALQVPGYIEMDIRFAWRPRKHLELAVVGQNLLQDEHYEFTGTQFVADQPTAVPRSVYGKVTWTW